ncbi:hypothetical protein Dsin_031875 [Dipteronia sinensis]|uniref:HMA domain-containing protein n=1 Tax=Dipteronia sinensis TaxID=43782 RepID=A0AAD9ZNN5_9ROSI|nr:hypothetical protein Dsin_031875 [Dipteronia sinensis]
MKQKVVIKVMVNGHKCRPKVLKIVVGAYGVESVAWKGDDKNQIEVIGDGLDPAVLTQLLRKKIGHADLVSVEEKKEEKKDGPKLQVLPMPSWPCYEAVPCYNHYGFW